MGESTIPVSGVTAASFEQPSQYCDIVMKGGVTSGVVYPPAILRIAQRFRLKNIGGTSAGAIAAALAAAAEYWRATHPAANGGAGYMKFKQNVMDWLPKRSVLGSNLQKLFLPTIFTWPLFRVALWAIGVGSALRRFTILGVANLVVTFVALVLVVYGFVVAFIPLGLTAFEPSAKLAALCAIVGALILAAIFFFILPFTNCGMCTGGKRWTLPGILHISYKPLTFWLAAQIDDIAGKVKNEPLTFGDLEEAGIALRMITTCLTMGRPFQLPIEKNKFYFRPNELGAYFPSYVVDWMVAHPRPASNAARRKLIEAHGYRALPDGVDLPVVVGTRLSLSFPFLLSALRFYAVDETLPTYNANDPKLEPVWFSDGGLSSNFPISMFDAPLPRWPTLGISLDSFAPGVDTNNPNNQVWIPENTRSGVQSTWTRFASWFREVPRTGGFAGAMINAMQNWQDTMQSEAPGYRDRIAHVCLKPNEGGLNLTMPRSVIDALFQRGETAGQLLVEQFEVPAPQGAVMTWQNHQWIRLRASLDIVERYTHQFEDGWNGGGEPGYPVLLTNSENAASYPLSGAQVAAGHNTVAEILQIVAATSPPAGSSLSRGAPHPPSDFHYRPRI